MTTWRKASRSGTHGDQNCVEVAAVGEQQIVVGVRDSKDPDGPKLYLTPRAWTALVEEVKFRA